MQKKKNTKKVNLKIENYDILKSFEKLNKLQEMALSKERIIIKDGEQISVPSPDFAAAVKIEELKGKLFNLYGKDEKDCAKVTVMGDVKLEGGTTLELNVGKETNDED